MFYIGVDIGQKQDHTAIGIIERPARLLEDRDPLCNAQPPLPLEILVRRAERLPLGVPYTRVVDRINTITNSEPFAGQCALIVDATGVGAPIIDMLRSSGLRCELTAVTITGGERQAGTSSRPSVPKKDLLAALQLSLKKGEMRISRRMPAVRTLIHEMMHLNSNKRSEHDDLVLALALACWRARRPRIACGPGVITGLSGC
jgi:hypothetical protein